MILCDGVARCLKGERYWVVLSKEERAVCDSRPKRSRSDFKRSVAKFGGRRELGTPQIKGDERVAR